MRTYLAHISEDGTQLIVNEGRKYEKYDLLPGPAEGCITDRRVVYGFCIEANRTELTGSCMITCRSLLTGEVIQPTIPAVRACDLPVGATASVIAQAAKRARTMMPHRH